MTSKVICEIRATDESLTCVRILREDNIVVEISYDERYQLGDKELMLMGTYLGSKNNFIAYYKVISNDGTIYYIDKQPSDGKNAYNVYQEIVTNHEIKILMSKFSLTANKVNSEIVNKILAANP